MMLFTQHITHRLLVMVSSELVVLLIVCVGINTGSAQQPGELATNTENEAMMLIRSMYTAVIIREAQ